MDSLRSTREAPGKHQGGTRGQERTTWTACKAPGRHQGGRKGPFGQPGRHQEAPFKEKLHHPFRVKPLGFRVINIYIFSAVSAGTEGGHVKRPGA